MISVLNIRLVPNMVIRILRVTLLSDSEYGTFRVRLIAGVDILSEPVDINVQLTCMVLFVTFVAQGDKINDVIASVLRERNQVMASCLFLIVNPTNNA